MRTHRQTHRLRVDDHTIRTILRERLVSRKPTDAASIRDLGFACGNDRHVRLRHEVERELATHSAAPAYQPPIVVQQGDVSATVSAKGTVEINHSRPSTSTRVEASAPQDPARPAPTSSHTQQGNTGDTRKAQRERLRSIGTGLLRLISMFALLLIPGLNPFGTELGASDGAKRTGPDRR